MKTINNIRNLIKLAERYKRSRKSIGFIPTMGALHKGHLSLIRQSRKENDIVVVSIFVNPKQFNNPDDLKNYPRTIDRDIALIGDLADIVFLPEAQDIYPSGFGTQVHVSALADIGEGLSRPGHFDGMATVVLKLFNLVRPEKAYFGKKDYQQYLIVQQMAMDLNLPIHIVGSETVRESTGLALSSRNIRLSYDEQAKAAIIYHALSEGKKMIEQGERNAQAVKQKISDILRFEQSWKTEYVEIRSIQDFSEPTRIQADAVILIAGYIGTVRLIDNIEVHIL